MLLATAARVEFPFQYCRVLVPQLMQLLVVAATCVWVPCQALLGQMGDPMLGAAFDRTVIPFVSCGWLNSCLQGRQIGSWCCRVSWLPCPFSAAPAA